MFIFFNNGVSLLWVWISHKELSDLIIILKVLIMTDSHGLTCDGKSQKSHLSTAKHVRKIYCNSAQMIMKTLEQ